MDGIRIIWASEWQNHQNGISTQRRLRSDWASAQSDQSLCCALNGYHRNLAFFMWTTKPWSDWADDQADLSLRWAHMQFCGFCRELAYLTEHRLILFRVMKDNGGDAEGRPLIKVSKAIYGTLNSMIIWLNWLTSKKLCKLNNPYRLLLALLTKSTCIIKTSTS